MSVTEFFHGESSSQKPVERSTMGDGPDELPPPPPLPAHLERQGTYLSEDLDSEEEDEEPRHGDPKSRERRHCFRGGRATEDYSQAPSNSEFGNSGSEGGAFNTIDENDVEVRLHMGSPQSSRLSISSSESGSRGASESDPRRYDHEQQCSPQDIQRDQSNSGDEEHPLEHNSHFRFSRLGHEEFHDEAVRQLNQLHKVTVFMNVGMIPQLKVEVFSSKALDLIWLVLGLASLYTAIVALYTIVEFSRDEPGHQWTIVILAGTTHLLAAAVVTFVFVAYPQRILRKLCFTSHSKPLPEQLLVAGVTCLLFGNPTTSFWGADWFWESAIKAAHDEDTTQGFLFRKLSYESDYELTVLSLISVVMSYSCIGIFGVLAELTRVTLRSVESMFTKEDEDQKQKKIRKGKGRKYKKVKDKRRKPPGKLEVQKSQAVLKLKENGMIPRLRRKQGSGMQSQRFNLDADLSFSSDSEAENDSESDPTALHENSGEINPMYKITEDIQNLIQKARDSLETILWDERGYKELLYISKTGVINVLLAGVLVVWNCIYATKWEVAPNVVPLVGIISVFRVCAYNDGSGISLCSDEKVFYRALGTGITFVLEVGLLYTYGRLLSRAKRALKRVPYSVTRPQQISFLFYAFQSVSLFFLGTIMGILVVSVEPVEYWIDRPRRNALGEFYVDVDPLFHVGVSGATISLTYYGFIVAINYSMMAWSYLPADSEGIRGCFCPLYSVTSGSDHPRGLGERTSSCLSEADTALENKIARMTALGKQHSAVGDSVLSEKQKEAALLFFRERLMVRHQLRLEDQERPVYIMIEEGARRIQQVVPFMALKRCRQISSLDSQKLRNLGTSESFRNIASMAKAELEGEPPVITMIRDLNVLILESEILAFNFTVVTYFLSNNRGDMSVEEEAALIESPNYTYEEHIIDDRSDTHCLVSSSDDRLFIAFRGTVSDANRRTDLALQLHPWDVANQKWLIEDLEDDQESVFASRGLTAHVHRGFLESYVTVRNQVLKYVDQLAVDFDGNQIRAVICTGHSLGGALATLCAFDVAVHLRKRTGRDDVAVACSTFGCPRVGNLVFMSRYNLLVPKTNRFVNAGDIIPKSPPRNFLRSITLTGYRHVGRQILLDSNGRFIISPSRIERFLQHGNMFYGNRPSAHSCTRYAFSFLLWCIQAHYHVFDPDLWHVHMETMDSIGRSRERYMNPVVRERYREIIRNKGFLYRVGKKEVRNVSVQTGSDDFPTGHAEEEAGFRVITPHEISSHDSTSSIFDNFRRLAHTQPDNEEVKSVLNHMSRVFKHFQDVEPVSLKNDADLEAGNDQACKTKNDKISFVGSHADPIPDEEQIKLKDSAKLLKQEHDLDKNPDHHTFQRLHLPEDARNEDVLGNTHGINLV